MRRRAVAKLRDAEHEVLIRGPEGEQVHYDERGRRTKSKARTEYPGFKRYMRQLEIEAALVDPEVEKLAEDLQKADDFWGETQPLEENEPVPDG